MAATSMPLVGIVVGTALIAACVPVATPSREHGCRGTCRNNMKQLLNALVMYSQDWNDQLPPLRDSATTREVLWPYVKTKLVCVVSGKPFGWNASLSGQKFDSIKNPERLIACYDMDVHSGSRVVGYLDMHVKTIPEGDFASLKKTGAIR